MIWEHESITILHFFLMEIFAQSQCRSLHAPVRFHLITAHSRKRKQAYIFKTKKLCWPLSTCNTKKHSGSDTWFELFVEQNGERHEVVLHALRSIHSPSTRARSFSPLHSHVLLFPCAHRLWYFRLLPQPGVSGHQSGDDETQWLHVRCSSQRCYQRNGIQQGYFNTETKYFFDIHYLMYLQLKHSMWSPVAPFR